MRSPLTPDRWTKVESLFIEAAQLPEPDRQSFLERECAGDRELQVEIVSLLRFDTREPGVLAALQEGARSVLTGVPREGAMLGPWRVERELGRGGMSVVYLAVRADGQFSRRVAIKLIKRGMDTLAVLNRLRQERRILAALDHVSIARLLDGGTTPDGLPYIVMEYVEGLPIDRWCDANGLGVERRCELIGMVCDAVSYAHRNLVIHRDLKPGNILVGSDGNPKLLDFGIAKVLSGGGEAAGGPETRGPMRLLTPEYASPEQMAGNPVGTATDVYSLGVILFELLTGERPRFADDRAGEKASDVALRNGKGQRWTRRIRGDLDNILQMALRTDPERRYLSVGELQADLRLHLSGMPVAAREETLLYRWGKFARRHRAAVVAGALAMLSLAGGMATTLWQSRRAEAARIAAEKERRLADRRFKQTREMAGKFLFEFPDAIASLTGSTSARKLAIDTGIRYYDSLVKEADGNRDLLEEIARGYDQLGDVQGNVYYSNLGDVSGAEASYRKAQAIRERVSDSSASFLRDRMGGYLRVGEALLGRNDNTGAARYLRMALALGKDSRAASSYEIRDTLVRVWSRLGDALSNEGLNGEAIEPFLNMLALRSELARGAGNNVAVQRDPALARIKVGNIYAMAGRLDQAREQTGLALTAFRRVSADEPGNPEMRRYLCIASQAAAGLSLAGFGLPGVSAAQLSSDFQMCSDFSEGLVTADPGNRRALVDVVAIETEYGDWLRREKDPQSAALVWRRGREAADRLAALSAGVPGNEAIFAQLYRRLAMAAIDAGRFEDALENLRKADQYAAAVEKINPDSPGGIDLLNEVACTRALVFTAQKRWREAINVLTGTIAADETIAARDPKNLMPAIEEADQYAMLARCYAEDGQRGAGVSAMRNAIARYNAVAAQRPLAAEEGRKRADLLAMLAGREAN